MARDIVICEDKDRASFDDLPWELREQIWQYAAPVDLGGRGLIPYHKGLWGPGNIPEGEGDACSGDGPHLHGPGQCLRLALDQLPRLCVDLHCLPLYMVCRQSRKVTKAWLESKGFTPTRTPSEAVLYSRSYRPGEDVMYITQEDWLEFCETIFENNYFVPSRCSYNLYSEDCYGIAVPLVGTLPGTTTRPIDWLGHTVWTHHECEQNVLVLDDEALPDFSDPKASYQPLWTVHDVTGSDGAFQECAGSEYDLEQDAEMDDAPQEYAGIDEVLEEDAGSGDALQDYAASCSSTAPVCGSEYDALQEAVREGHPPPSGWCNFHVRPAVAIRR